MRRRSEVISSFTGVSFGLVFGETNLGSWLSWVISFTLYRGVYHRPYNNYFAGGVGSR